MSAKRGTVVVVPGNASLNKEFIYLLCVIIGGFALGFLSRFWEGGPVFGAFWIDWGIWIFTLTVVPFFSNHPFSAVINNIFYAFSVLFSRWLYDHLVNQADTLLDLKFFAVCLLAVAVFAFLIWIAKGNGGTLRILCAAIAPAFLIAEGFRFSIYEFPEFLNLLYALILLWFMNRSLDERGRTAGCAAILTLLILQFRLLQWL